VDGRFGKSPLLEAAISIIDLEQIREACVKRAANALGGFAGYFKGVLHQLQSEGNENILPYRQLYGADVEGADLAEGPAVEEPFGAVGSAALERVAGGALVLAVGAELNVVQEEPSPTLDVGREAEEIEQRPGMTMIGVDEGEAEFIASRDFADEIRVAAGMDTDGGNKVGDQLGNLEADGAGFIDAAMSVGVDGFDRDAEGSAMLAMNGGGNNRGGEAGERSDLDDAARREDADERSEEKIIARADPTRMAAIVPVDHGVKKIELAGRGNFFRAAELLRELPIFNLELLKRLELADIERSGGAGRLVPLTQARDLPRELEAAASRPISHQIEIT